MYMHTSIHFLIITSTKTSKNPVFDKLFFFVIPRIKCILCGISCKFLFFCIFNGYCIPICVYFDQIQKILHVKMKIKNYIK